MKKRSRRRRRRRPGRRLRRSRSCSALRRRARESALYLTPNQLRSAVPDKALFSPSLSRSAIERRAATYTYTRRVSIEAAAVVNQQWHSRGRPANTKSPGAKYTEAFPTGPPHLVLRPLHSPLSPGSSLLLFTACMHPSNELSLATL